MYGEEELAGQHPRGRGQQGVPEGQSDAVAAEPVLPKQEEADAQVETERQCVCGAYSDRAGPAALILNDEEAHEGDRE